jgi:hypothetical protein
MGLAEICKTIDELPEPWTQRAVVEAGHGESYVAQTIKGLLRVGAIECLDKHTRPFRYKRLVSLIQYYESGSFQGIYRKEKPQQSYGAGQQAGLEERVKELEADNKALEAEVAMLRAEIEQPIEVNPLDVLEALDHDDLARVIATVIHNQMAVTAPMKIRIAELHQRVLALQNEKESTIRRYETDLQMVNDKLSNQNRRLEDTTDELARLREDAVKKYPPVKVVFGEKRPRNDTAYKPHVIHRKTPASVLNRNR